MSASNIWLIFIFIAILLLSESISFETFYNTSSDYSFSYWLVIFYEELEREIISLKTDTYNFKSEELFILILLLTLLTELIKEVNNFWDIIVLSLIKVDTDYKIVFDSSSVNFVKLLLIYLMHSPIFYAIYYFSLLVNMLALVISWYYVTN